MSWANSPLCHKYPPDLKEDPPIWVSEKDCQLSQLLGDRRANPFQDWLEEHWKKIELSLNRTPLPDLHLLKNIGSSPNGTFYPRYLVQGLHSLRDCVEDKASLSYEKNGTKAEKERKAAVLDWEERHQDIKLNHDLTCMFRTWPSDLMDKLDEIDRQTAWSGRRIYIELLVEAEKQMQELIKFWKDCELITGQRTPPSPAIRSPDSFPESPPQIGRESGENQSPNGSLSSPPTQAGSSQLQTKASGPAHKSRKKIKLSEPQNTWDERLRPRTKTAKA